MWYNDHMRTSQIDQATARVHIGGITAMDWEKITVAGVHGTYTFLLPDESPHVNDACYAFECQKTVYVYAAHGSVVEIRVIDPQATARERRGGMQ